jgi:GH15 family glucan-1,4-alpha-glucosidase
MPFGEDEQTLRSAVMLKSLSCERTDAIVAAPTMSLPEWVGGERNWEYRFSWVRDSVFTVRALNELGCEREADRFLKFISRSSAGDADELQIMYAVDGKRRLTELELKHLEGYRCSRPVRVGNAAAKQNQLDVYGELLQRAWEWHAKGRRIQRRYWDFLTDAVNTACRKWDGPDFGIWEFRGGPRHYVHSKAMCWGAVDHGIRLAREQGLPAPLEDWEEARNRMRKAIEQDGYDEKRGIFVQAFGNHYLDSALLLLPRIGIVPYDDPRMVRTANAIREELDSGGLLLRYSAPDGLPGSEGAFLPCTFWLVSCLAYQKRFDLAWEYYRRAAACANDLGLFSEEYDVKRGEMLGNFPQALTHVSQIMARLALG